MMEEYAMPLEFDVKLEPKDMYRFNMYQTYSGFSGLSSIIFAIALFGLAIYTYGEVSLPNTIILSSTHQRNCTLCSMKNAL